MNRATFIPEQVERFKLVVTATIGSFFWTNTFLKPVQYFYNLFLLQLNPILGETLQAYYKDGTQVWAEQITHHPPVSYFLVHGPNKKYIYYGYYLIDAKAGLNSITLINKGKRSIVFKDGQKIDFDFPTELYTGTFVGTLRQETTGKICFKDQANQISLDIIMGKNKKKPTDYFEGDLIVKGEKASFMHGSYLSYINFDNIRYWDYREVTPYRIQMAEDRLESDHQKRIDLISLKKGDIAAAQRDKEQLENLQRNDRKLRETFQKNKLKKTKQ